MNHERWLVSYADFITLLFAFFVVMYSVSQVDSKKVGRFTESFRDALEWQPIGTPGRQGGKGVLTNLSVPIAAQAVKDLRTASAFEEEKSSIRQGLIQRAGKVKALAGLTILEVRGELVLRLPERLLFDRAEAVLYDEAKSALAAISEELKDRPIRLRVEGHTDNMPIRSPRYPSNWELSMARAMAVVRFFLEDGKIDPGSLAAAGYSEYHPVGDNATQEGRAQNRRVDLIIVADLDQHGRAAAPPKEEP